VLVLPVKAQHKAKPDLTFLTGVQLTLDIAKLRKV